MTGWGRAGPMLPSVQGEGTGCAQNKPSPKTSPQVQQTPKLLPVLPGDPERGVCVCEVSLLSSTSHVQAVVFRYQNEPGS